MKEPTLALQLGKIIKTYRLKANFTQEVIAEHLNVHSNYIYLIENGKRNITLHKFFKMNKLLKIPLTTITNLYKENNQL